MGLREALNQHKNATVVVACAVLAAAAVVIVVESHAGHRPGPVTVAFYSDDDGQTYFRDDVNKLYPFVDQSGKQAYRADVFRCSDGKTFVGVLSKLTDRAKARIAELRSQPNPDVQAISDTISAGTLIKKPGDPKWCSINSAEAGAVLTQKCPDGGAVYGVSP